MDCNDFEYSTHAVKRMIEKDITTFEVEQTVLFGEVIQLYESDKPYPSQLLLTFVNDKPIHVVVAKNTNNNICIIITCYRPDLDIWNQDFKTKKRT